MKKDKQPNNLAVIDNYNFCDRHTNRHTDGHGDSMNNPAQRAESVKNIYMLKFTPNTSRYLQFTPTVKNTPHLVLLDF